MSVIGVEKRHLDALSPNDAVDLVRKLIWAEATSSNIPKSTINMPGEIYAPDGGIDGIVVYSKSKSRNGVIRKGCTCYQVKSGNFSLKDSSIDGILLDKDATRVKDRIESCLDGDGTLIVVFTKWDAPELRRDQHRNKFLERLKKIDQKYADSKIEIWNQNTIIGCLQDYPSLCLDISGLTPSLQTHETWSRLDEMKHDTHFGDEQLEFVEDVRRRLREKDGQSIHVRVTGDPGIGKTRLVLEATRQEDLSPLVLYAEDPGKLEHMNFMDRLAAADRTSHAILVVDECDPSSQSHIWNKLKDKSPKIKLVTIFNEPSESGGTTVHMDAPTLNDEQLGKILAGYGVPDLHIAKWVKLCRPSPRLAHMVGQNLRRRPDDIFKSPDTVRVWDRCIASRADLDTPDFNDRKNVLCWLALFKRFGFGLPFDGEGELIAKKIEEHHGIRRGDFNKIVKKLKEMKILQGHQTLYITPKMLHIKMWMEWWSTYGNPPLLVPKDLVEFPKLVAWYQDMFEYARESPEASLVVEKTLSDARAFGPGGMLSTELDADFFLTMAQVDAKNALAFLNRTINKMTMEDLEGFATGRRQTVQALATIAKKADNFADSAKLLLALAEAENEGCANNASGTFVRMFYPGSSEVAPTELPPLSRLDVVRGALESGSKERRILAIRACNAALELGTFRVGVPDGDGMRDGFKPRRLQSDSAVVGYYTAVLDMLKPVLDGSPGDERREASSTILERARLLLTDFPSASETVIELLRKVRENGGADEEVMERATEIVDFDGDRISEYAAEALRDLMDSIDGNDYPSKMRSHVAMLAFTDRGIRREAHEREVESLARQSLDADLLGGELPWLVTAKAKNGGEFGRALGMADGKFRFLRTILDAQRAEDDASAFTCGYFSALFERDREMWESELDRMAGDVGLCRFVPDVTRWSGVTERAGRRIISLIRRRSLDFNAMGRFQHGTAVKMMPEPVFAEWMEILGGEGDPRAGATALELFHAYYVHKNPDGPLPRDTALDILFREGVAPDPCPGPPGTVMVEFYWRETCILLIKQHPDAGIVVAEKILAGFSKNSMFGPLSSTALDVLDCVAGQDPSGLWRIASRYVGPPLDQRAFLVTRWLRGGAFDLMPEGMLARIPLGDVFSWIDRDANVRAPYAAGFIPPKFEIARKILKRYGAVDGVGRNLVINFLNEGWSGLASRHYGKKKERFGILREKEEDATVRKWLDDYIDVLDKHMRETESWEERVEL